jgi:hypothetical protein
MIRNERITVPAWALESFLVASAPTVDRDRPVVVTDPESGTQVRLPARFLLELLAAWKTRASEVCRTVRQTGRERKHRFPDSANCGF